MQDGPSPSNDDDGGSRLAWVSMLFFVEIQTDNESPLGLLFRKRLTTVDPIIRDEGCVAEVKLLKLLTPRRREEYLQNLFQEIPQSSGSES
ncbi:hypothetical protein U1Q18_021480 [Sarracenia purpurea var. burkii]